MREWPELLLTIQVVAVLPFLVRAISFACRPASNHLLWTVLSQRENRYDPPLLLCAITLINTPVGGWSLFPLHSTRALVLETESEDAGNALRMNVIWFKAEQTGVGSVLQWVVQRPLHSSHGESPTVNSPWPFPVKTLPNQIGRSRREPNLCYLGPLTLGPPAETFEGPRNGSYQVGHWGN